MWTGIFFLGERDNGFRQVSMRLPLATSKQIQCNNLCIWIFHTISFVIPLALSNWQLPSFLHYFGETHNFHPFPVDFRLQQPQLPNKFWRLKSDSDKSHQYLSIHSLQSAWLFLKATYAPFPSMALPEAKVNPLLPVSEPVNVMQALGAGEEVGV